MHFEIKISLNKHKYYFKFIQFETMEYTVIDRKIGNAIQSLNKDEWAFKKRHAFL